jgi:biotin operon repressor
MRDPIVIRQFVQLDRNGELEGIKQMLDPQKAEPENRFLGEIAPHIAVIINLCAALATVTKAVTGTADMVALATKLAAWVRSALEGAAVKPEDLGLRERLLGLLFEATTNRREGLSDEKLKRLLGCTEAELAEAIAALKNDGLARKSHQGDWKYAQPRA